MKEYIRKNYEGDAYDVMRRLTSLPDEMEEYAWGEKGVYLFTGTTEDDIPFEIATYGKELLITGPFRKGGSFWTQLFQEILEEAPSDIYARVSSLLGAPIGEVRQHGVLTVMEAWRIADHATTNSQHVEE